MTFYNIFINIEGKFNFEHVMHSCNHALLSILGKINKKKLKQILGLIVSYFEVFSATKGCQKQFYIQKRLYKYLLKYSFKDLSTLYPIGPIYNPAINGPPWREYKIYTK